MKSRGASEKLGGARYHTIQKNFSLNNRRCEDELAQVCRQEGVILIPYSPLAGGVLSGKYQGGATPEGARFSRYLQMEGRQAEMGRRFVNATSLAATDRYLQIAEEAGLHPVTLAPAWSTQHYFAPSTIVEDRAYEQLDSILREMGLVMEVCARTGG